MIMGPGWVPEGGPVMRKIRVRHDMKIPGWGVIREGAEFKVERFNSRFVYVALREGVILRLARKTDCEKVY